MNLFNHAQYKSVEAYVKQNHHVRVLDIGFGNGKLIHRLSSDESLQLYGLELSADMIRQVEQRYPNETGMWRLHLGSVEKMPYADCYFDIQYSINTIYFWTSLDAGMREMWRTANNHGVGIITFYTKEALDTIRYTREGFKKYTKDEVVQAFVRNGFQIVSVETILKERAYIIIVRKKED